MLDGDFQNHWSVSKIDVSKFIQPPLKIFTSLPQFEGSQCWEFLAIYGNWDRSIKSFGTHPSRKSFLNYKVEGGGKKRCFIFTSAAGDLFLLEVGG